MTSEHDSWNWSFSPLLSLWKFLTPHFWNSQTGLRKRSAEPGCYTDLFRVDPYLNHLNKIPRGTPRSQMGSAEVTTVLLTCFAEQSWAILALLTSSSLLSTWLSPADWVCLLLPCLTGTFSDVSVFPESQAAKREAQKETGISSPSCFGLLFKVLCTPCKRLLEWLPTKQWVHSEESCVSCIFQMSSQSCKYTVMTKNRNSGSLFCFIDYMETSHFDQKIL